MLGTRALHVAIRENTGTARLLLPSEFTVRFTSDNEAIIEFPEDQPPPAQNAYAVTITAAGPKSAFQAHHHTIGQIDGLPDALDALGLRITAIEVLLPSVNPSAQTGTTGESLGIEIPDASEMFPGKVATGADATKLPKPAGLLPAIHDATVDSISVPLPLPTGFEGQVYRNDSGSLLLVPGGLGRRGGYLDPLGYAGSDGRVWYRLSRDGDSNSFYPFDFERELFMLHVNDQMLRAGSKFTLEFKLGLRLFNAITRAQYLLRIDVGSAPGQGAPSPVGVHSPSFGRGIRHRLARHRCGHSPGRLSPNAARRWQANPR